MPSVEQLAQRAAFRYPLPPVLYRLVNLNLPGVEDAPEAGAVLAGVVSRDADLDRRLRHVSQARGRSQPPPEAGASLEDAVRQRGFRRVHTAAVVISLIGGLPVKTTVVDYLRFWRYSVAVAFLTQSIAYHRRTEWVEFGVTAGLHDVGRLLLEDADPVGMVRVRERQVAGEGPWMQIEREELGFTAFEMTLALLREWRFPDQLIESVAGLVGNEVPELSVALRDSVLSARALEFATKTGRRHEVVPDVELVVNRYFEGIEGFTERVDGLLGAAMVSISAADGTSEPEAGL